MYASGGDLRDSQGDNVSKIRKVRRFLRISRYDDRCYRIGGRSGRYPNCRARAADAANRAHGWPSYTPEGYMHRNLWSIESRDGWYVMDEAI